MSINTSEEVIIEPFNGDQTLADTIAALHLQIRFEQRQDGTNDFRPEVTNIYDSQDDLRGMQTFYVESGGNFWIARDRITGRVAGFVGLQQTSKSVGVLKRMAVMKEYRRQGIGRRMVETLITWAREHDFREIVLGTSIHEQAHALYLKLGFKDAGFGKQGADYLMRLDLSEE